MPTIVPSPSPQEQVVWWLTPVTLKRGRRLSAVALAGRLDADLATGAPRCAP